jgi:hypothetical protein
MDRFERLARRAERQARRGLTEPLVGWEDEEDLPPEQEEDSDLTMEDVWDSMYGPMVEYDDEGDLP